MNQFEVTSYNNKLCGRFSERYIYLYNNSSNKLLLYSIIQIITNTFCLTNCMFDKSYLLFKLNKM